MNIRILLADDHALLREGLKCLIERDGGMEIVGEAENGKQTVEVARKSRPHVVVMDVSMPGLNGMEATRKLLKDSPHIRVIALSGHDSRAFVREMLKAGASGYVLKSRAYAELARAIREVMRGKKFLSPDIAQGVVDEYVGISAASGVNPAFVLLTDREREVLQLIAEGLSTKEAASNLGISIKTAETHRHNIMEKLNLHSVADLTKYAICEGITSLDG
jgi:DNA-binding NarL/FixJ family response regulator